MPNTTLNRTLESSAGHGNRLLSKEPLACWLSEREKIALKDMGSIT
jgi:hypothetical protein